MTLHNWKASSLVTYNWFRTSSITCFGSALSNCCKIWSNTSLDDPHSQLRIMFGRARNQSKSFKPRISCWNDLAVINSFFVWHIRTRLVPLIGISAALQNFSDWWWSGERFFRLLLPLLLWLLLLLLFEPLYLADELV